MTTLQKDRRDRGERLCETNHAHIISILLQPGLFVTPVKTGQASNLPINPTTAMPTRVCLSTGCCLVFMTLSLATDTVQHRQGSTARSSAVLAYSSTSTTPLPTILFSELYHSFQSSRVSCSSQPKQLGPATPFMQVNLNCFLLLFKDLSGVVSGSSVQVEEPVAISAQVPTTVAEYDGKSFSIIVVMTSRPLWSTNSTTPFTATQTFHMI